jgi:hypothetical protein
MPLAGSGYHPLHILYYMRYAEQGIFMVVGRDPIAQAAERFILR